MRKCKTEAGQAIVLVLLATSIFLLGAVGLAIDGSHLYAQRQMAQAAADAGAQAGILSIFDGSNGTGTHAFSTGSSFTCGTSDAKTPCYYAQTMNGFNSTSDTVKVDFPSAATVGVDSSKLSASDPVNLIRVVVTRQVNTTFMGMLGPTASTIGATGVAAIVAIVSPVPILVTHPTLASSFETKGTGSAPKITICGGPRRSVQVNSSNSGSLSSNGNGVIDLSHAGPNDPGNCTTGTGADFGDWGGPSTPPFVPQLGSTGHFIQPASPLDDPLASVSAPSAPAVNGVPPASGTALAAGSHGCPTGSGGCTLVFPGNFTSDLQAKNKNVVFAPGIYYMNGANFSAAANGNMYYATGLTDSGSGQTIGSCCGTSTGWGAAGNTPANAGILVYMTGPSGKSGDATGTISISANSNVNLVGSPNNSSYEGILFFVDRNAAAATHSLDGGGGLTLTGTIYMPESLSVMQSTPSQYQLLHFQGNAGSSTHITGEIITSALLLEGTPGIVMNLDPSATKPVRQVALVQ